MLNMNNTRSERVDEDSPSAQNGATPSSSPMSLRRPARHPRHHETHRALQALIPVMASLLTLYKVGTDAFGEWAEVEQEKQESRVKTRLVGKGLRVTDTDKGQFIESVETPYSFIEHMLALTTGMAKALALILVMAALIALAFVAQPVSTAIVMTTLIMFTLWASEHLSRER